MTNRIVTIIVEIVIVLCSFGLLASGCDEPLVCEGFICRSDADCPCGGQVCNTATNRCTVLLLDGEGPCASDHDCDESAPYCVDREDASWCSLVPLGNVGQVCTSAEDCVAGLDCFESKCLVPVDSACKRNVDCIPGRTCVPDDEGFHVCGLPNGRLGLCDDGDAEDCNASFACEDGLCLAKKNVSCQFDYECSSPLVCRPSDSTLAAADLCLPAANWAEACLMDGDCERGICTSFRWCTSKTVGTACERDADCSREHDLTCRPNAVGARVCNTIGSPGDDCDTHDDCLDGACSPHFDWCAGIDTPCKVQSDCLASAGVVCRPVTDAGELFCATPGLPGELCTSDEQCALGVCGNGRCLQVIGGTCNQLVPMCPPQAVCRATGQDAPTTCEYPAKLQELCLRSADCAANLVCEAARLLCVLPADTGDCYDKTDCAHGLVCFPDQICRVKSGLGESCGSPADGWDDDLCVAGLICGGLYVCQYAYTSPPGTPCHRKIECLPLLNCGGGFCTE